MKRSSLRRLVVSTGIGLSCGSAWASGGGIKHEDPPEPSVHTIEVSPFELSNSTIAHVILNRFIENLQKPDFHGTLVFQSDKKPLLKDLRVSSVMAESLEIDFLKLARATENPAERAAIEQVAKNSEQATDGEVFVPKLDIYTGQVTANLVAKSIDEDTIRGALTFAKDGQAVPIDISAKITKVGQHYVRLQNIRFEVSGFSSINPLDPLVLKADCATSEQLQSGDHADLKNPANWVEAPCGFTYRVNRSTDPQSKNEDYFRFIYSYSRSGS